MDAFACSGEDARRNGSPAKWDYAALPRPQEHTDVLMGRQPADLPSAAHAYV